MIAGIFGWPMSGDELVGIIMAVFLAAYLIYVLINPERL